MTASRYDGRKPEPPYQTDSDVVVNLQEQIDALTEERDELRTELQEQIDALTEERDELRTELQRLQSSPVPVAGGVPEPSDDDWDAFGFQQGTKAEILRVWNRALASRLPAIKPGDQPTKEGGEG